MIVTVRCGEMISSCLPQIDGIQTHISIDGVLILQLQSVQEVKRNDP